MQLQQAGDAETMQETQQEGIAEGDSGEGRNECGGSVLYPFCFVFPVLVGRLCPAGLFGWWVVAGRWVDWAGRLVMDGC